LQSASKPGNLPKNLDSIPNKDRIGTQNDIRFKIRLGHQETVERVFMMRWQALQGEYVRESNWEDLQTIRLLLCQNCGQGSMQREFAQLNFDDHFPDTGHAEQDCICPILKERESRR
jgi:hypothetical protein